MVGPRAQLRVRLRSDIERVHVARQLDVLDEVTVGRRSREPQPSVGDLLAIRVVHLVAVTVALRSDRCSVEVGDEGALG